ncbi:MAG: IS3 family transposase [Gallionellaceae bacterium]|nr:IS3 family transposase [Gallionellaceae bacterium]
MPKTHPPYAPEFRQQIVELVKAGRNPAELAKEFGCHVTSISNWISRATVGPARETPAALSQAEREELIALRRKLRQVEMERDILGKGYGLVRTQRRQDIHTVYTLIAANQADFPVRVMCRSLKVSASGYYDWKDRPVSARAVANAALLERIQTIHQASDATYGRPRILVELREAGDRIGHNRVARLMRQAAIRGVSRRRGYVVTTERDPRQRPAPDLVKRAFVATQANQLWVADMTYLPTWAGFLYLAVVLDVYSRRVVGWAFAEQMTASLVIMALNMALTLRKPEGVIHHSDQGSQYTSLAFGQRCQIMGVRPSMGTVGDAYDNAMAESFFASLECELIARRTWKSKTEARLEVFTWIEAWYNPRRRHSALNYLSPINFERSQADPTVTDDNTSVHHPVTALIESP